MVLNILAKIYSILSVFIIFFACSSILHADDNIYNIYQQNIDETADNEVKAKENGLIKAKRLAFYKVLKRLVRQKDYILLPKVNDKAIERMIRSTSLPQEKFTKGNGRYLAKLNIRFIKDSIRIFLQNLNIAYAEIQSETLIILPIYNIMQKNLLWEDSNKWFDAWDGLYLGDQLVSMAMPLGDIGDMGIINSLEAANGKVDKLQQFADKYNVGGIFIPTATISTRKSTDSITDKIIINVTAMVRSKTWQMDDLNLSFIANSDMAMDDILKQIANQTAISLFDIWKNRNLLDFQDGMRNITFNAPIDSLDDWIKLQNILKKIASIRNIILENININEAIVKIEYLGRNNQLKLAFEKNNLSLYYDEDIEQWSISKK